MSTDGQGALEDDRGVLSEGVGEHGSGSKGLIQGENEKEERGNVDEDK